MKNFLTGLLCIILGVVIGFGSVVYLTRYTNSDIMNKILGTESGVQYLESDSSDQHNYELIKLAYTVAQVIKERDYNALAELVHPERGLLFTPSSTVNTASDRWFSATEVAGFGSDDETYVWGVDSAKGDPIEMTIDDYFLAYVFDQDYTLAPEIGVNKILKTGNALENVTSIFTDAEFVDLTYPGTEANDYLDWTTLRLVFEDYQGSSRLVAIIHCEWTV